MPYEKTNFVAFQTVVTAEALNKMEDGIADAHDLLKTFSVSGNTLVIATPEE